VHTQEVARGMEGRPMTQALEVRSEIVEFLRRELIGPDPRPEFAHLNGGEEILRPQDPPRLRYSAGVLFPGRAPVEQSDAASDDEIRVADTGPAEGNEPEDVTPDRAAGEPDMTTEHEVNRANDFLPSAMGVTALVHMPLRLKITVSGARYERRTQDGVGKPDKEGKSQPHHWRRPIQPASTEFDCAELIASGHVTRELPVASGSPDLKLALHAYARPYAGAEDPTRDRIVTFTLINRTVMSGDSPKDSECCFQCAFSVEDAAGSLCFLEYPESQGQPDDEEDRSLRLLYRHRKTFAVGHGCAAWWSDTESAAVERIRTDSLPQYEIKPVLPREIPGLDLSMRVLADAESAQGLQTCDALAAAYSSWIDEQTAIVAAPEFPEVHRSIATKHLAECRRCSQRIASGIALLRQDPLTRQAFAWMNEAMLMQQLHYDLAANHRRSWSAQAGVLSLERPFQAPDMEAPPLGKGKWRPFQLAFILMNLRSIAEPFHAERAIVDLIWFPTGGGKTEAYLGLTAMSVFHRRLTNPVNSGTTVLMRYTLRLLTTQQFQRAASLICACEKLRRTNEARLGAARISIGLWVGQSVTKNKNQDAVNALNAILQTGKPNPFVLLTCPWCGAEMGPVRVGNGYRAKGYRRAGPCVIFRCEDSACEFHDSRGLPLLVVDEAIYQERPTLVIGTVDKFALLPWYDDARALFGLDSPASVTPPDLIIQDELHLIAGALGSMVGMYEGTIDALCTRTVDGRRSSAKIVASTATICRAPQQVHSLYARAVSLFPPQALRSADSFFAEEVSSDRSANGLPGRLYVGMFGSALSSHVTAQIRVMSALLQAVKSAPSDSAAALDPYWTLMAYFNSLRELGHAATLVRADIREHLNAMWDRLNIRKPAPDSAAPDARRFINRDLELTSRISSDAITEVLQQLFNAYPGSADRRPVDVCLATNMIQVGLDVPRLGLMVVVGQPKTTSEYIQATSRVGRDARSPGLVVAVLNPAKPRDRSHFEHFRSYHQSVYRWVEPTSVTPFAVPVRERALHAQLITLARYWGDASVRARPSPPPSQDLIDRIHGVLMSRIGEVDPGERALSEAMFADLIQRWRTIQPPIYGHFGPAPQETPLMYPAGSEPRAIWATRSKATPSSMRNVDAGCDALVIQQFPQG
jgi:hypothetical protein